MPRLLLALNSLLTGLRDTPAEALKARACPAKLLIAELMSTACQTSVSDASRGWCARGAPPTPGGDTSLPAAAIVRGDRGSGRGRLTSLSQVLQQLRSRLDRRFIPAVGGNQSHQLQVRLSLGSSAMAVLVAACPHPRLAAGANGARSRTPRPARMRGDLHAPPWAPIPTPYCARRRPSGQTVSTSMQRLLCLEASTSGRTALECRPQAHTAGRHSLAAPHRRGARRSAAAAPAAWNPLNRGGGAGSGGGSGSGGPPTTQYDLEAQRRRGAYDYAPPGGSRSGGVFRARPRGGARRGGGGGGGGGPWPSCGRPRPSLGIGVEACIACTLLHAALP